MFMFIKNKMLLNIHKATLLIVYLLISCINIKPAVAFDLEKYTSPEYWQRQALVNMIPFWEKTIDRKNGGFYTNIMFDGTIDYTVGKYPRMISRIVYGFCVAYLLSGDEKYLQYAKHGMRYLIDYGWDKVNGGWHLYLNANNEVVFEDEAENLIANNYKNLFDQTYGNLGPVLYYFVTNNNEALQYVNRVHELLKQKAWDKKHGGYFAEVAANWDLVSSKKSFNAQIDTFSAYLLYYYLATKQTKLKDEIKDLAKIVKTKMIDPKTSYVGETFTGDWESVEDMLWVGHNLKTAWVLLRVANLTENNEYIKTAKQIAEIQMKENWDSKYYGWFFLFNRTPNVGFDTLYPQKVELKDWWTQTEGDFLMLYLYNITREQQYLQKFKESAYFWDNYVVDKKYGEVYPTLLPNGKPNRTQKGDRYKSAYHSMEHALFNYLYLSLFVKKQEATLYFNLNADKEGEKHYVNIIEDPSVIIKQVEINGKNWTRFDSLEGYLLLPKGKNLNTKVTFKAIK